MHHWHWSGSTTLGPARVESAFSSKQASGGISDTPAARDWFLYLLVSQTLPSVTLGKVVQTGSVKPAVQVNAAPQAHFRTAPDQHYFQTTRLVSRGDEARSLLTEN